MKYFDSFNNQSINSTKNQSKRVMIRPKINRKKKNLNKIIDRI